MTIDDMIADIRKGFDVERDDIRRTVVKLLEINNPGESIYGACRNRMQEVAFLRQEVKELKERGEEMRLALIRYAPGHPLTQARRKA